ncbi:MAG TPA: hypothetical protein VI729_05440, partial [Anaerolineales bacterium]|nr:hypothetical protein [Anaerolineales bacterium]
RVSVGVKEIIEIVSSVYILTHYPVKPTRKRAVDRLPRHEVGLFEKRAPGPSQPSSGYVDQYLSVATGSGAP